MDIIDALLTAQYYVGLSVSNFYPAEARVSCTSGISIVEGLLIGQYYVGIIPHFNCTTDETIFAYTARENYFTYHVQQSGETCASASAAMYLRELKQSTSISESAVISTAQSLGYDPLDGLTATETLNTINRYIKSHISELQYPYKAWLFSGIDYSSADSAALTYGYFSRSLSEYHMGACMFFASYPDLPPGPVSGHVVYAIGVQRQVNKPNDFTQMTKMYLANPQYERGSQYAVNVFNQDDFKRWLCHFTIYDGRL